MLQAQLSVIGDSVKMPCHATINLILIADLAEVVASAPVARLDRL